MRLSSNILLLAAIATPVINANSIMSRALSSIKLSIEKTTQSRQMLDSFLDFTSADTLCGVVALLPLLCPDSTDTFLCNDDFTELAYATAVDPIEYCDDSNEFCWIDTNLSADIDLTNLEGLSDVTYTFCGTYARVPSDDFAGLLNKQTCLAGESKVLVASLFEGIEDLSVIESCSTTIGGDECTCTVCDTGDDSQTANLDCPTLGINSEGGCIPFVSEDLRPIVLRFEKEEIKTDTSEQVAGDDSAEEEIKTDVSEPVAGDDSAADAVLPSIGLFVTLTFAALLV